MDKKIEETINNSEISALATNGPAGINVVPVSVFAAKEGEVHIYNFFMQKTEDNISSNPEVSFSCWKGFEGVQVKATVSVDIEGEMFNEAVSEMKERFPERTLKSVLRLTPKAIYSIAPGEDTSVGL